MTNTATEQSPRCGWGLVRRATLHSMALVLGTALALSAVFQWRAYHTAVEVQVNDGVEYSHTLSELVAQPLAEERRDALQLLMNACLADDGLVHAAIVTPTGTIQASEAGRQADIPDLTWARAFDRSTDGGPGYVRIERRSDGFCVLAPVREPAQAASTEPRLIGFVHLNYTLAEVGDEQLSMMLVTGGTTLVILVIACALSASRVRKVLRPIQDLVTRTAALADGDLTARADENAPGEVAVLARAFNTMADRVAASYGAIEGQVAARTAELQQRQRDLEAEIATRRHIEAELRQAKEAAEAASRAKTEFLANMSHELRTPLNGVIGMAELLMATNLTGKQEHFARSCMRSADALLALINDILDLSSVEAGTLRLEQADFDVWETIENVADVQVQMAADKHLKLTCMIDPAVPRHLRGDAHRFWQVLANLVNNAVKFTERGEITIRATSVTSDGDFETLRVDVEDTGIGIAPEQQQRLFQPFSQVDGSTTRRYGGSGLGLRIAKQIVELMGGTIGLRSEPGKGSAFWFTARLQRAHAADDHQRFCLLFPHLSRLRVLLVDDNAVNREMLTGQLAGWCIQAECAETGPAALAALRRAAHQHMPFHVAIIDMEMPEMDGLQLGRIVKGEPALKRTVLLMFTSVGDEEIRRQALDIGFHTALAKPVRQSALYEAILKAANSVAEQASGELDDGGKLVVDGAAHPHGRILVVEDNKLNQDLMVHILNRDGHQVVLADNGRVALDCLRAEPFDLVLMDCQMPEMDGFEATRRIREAERTAPLHPQSPAHLPIVALTANALEGDRQRCLDAGMDDYATKPLRPKELQQLIRDKLTDRANRATGTTPAFAKPPAPAPAGPAPSDPAAAFAVAELVERCLGNTGLVRRLLEQFAAEARALGEEIHEAVRAGDAMLTSRLAHKLKGVSANLSANALRESAQQVNVRAGEVVEGKADALLAELDRQIRNCVEQIPGAITAAEALLGEQARPSCAS